MSLFVPSPPYRTAYIQDGNSWREQGALEDEWREMIVAYLRNQYSIGCSAYLSGDEAIVANTAETIIFDTENFDIGGNYSTSTGVFTVPSNGAGRYRASGVLFFDVTADQDRILARVLINSSVTRASSVSASGTALQSVPYNFVFNLSATDTIAVEALNVNNNDSVLSGSTRSIFEVEYLGI